MDNLPPGVTLSMLPGNSDKDREWEQACDKILDMVLDSGLEPGHAIKAVETGIQMIMKGF